MFGNNILRMRNLYWSLLAIFIFAFLSCTENGNISPSPFVLEKSYGGDSLDYAVQIVETNDNHYLILGRTNSFGLGKTDAYLTKVDKQGSQLWENYYGGADFDDANQLIATADGGYFILGSTLSFGNGGMDMMLIKTNAAGKQQFFKTFGGIYYDKGFFIEQAQDGNYLIGGYSTNTATQDKDMALYKVNEAGESLWSATFGTDSTDVANGVIVLNDGYLLYGKTLVNPGNEDIMLVKTDFSGNELWQKTFGGEGVDDVLDMFEENGEFVACGFTGSFNENRNNDAYVMRFDAEGDTLMTARFGDDNQWDYEEGYAIAAAPDGGYYMAGRKRSAIWLVKMNSQFQEEWTQTYGDAYYQFTRIGFDLLVEEDGNVVIVGGETDSPGGNIRFLRLDPEKVN